VNTDPGASEPTEWQRLGSRLKGAREYLGFSQQYVAQKTGIPRSAVSDIERGERKVDSLELRKFARLYRYSVAYLLGEEPGPDSPVQALARRMSDLTEQDLNEVAKFAEFLRFSAMQREGAE
jgi:transcriptional regulator with XRE-family HTH domain